MIWDCGVVDVELVVGDCLYNGVVVMLFDLWEGFWVGIGVRNVDVDLGFVEKFDVVVVGID